MNDVIKNIPDRMRIFSPDTPTNSRLPCMRPWANAAHWTMTFVLRGSARTFAVLH